MAKKAAEAFQDALMSTRVAARVASVDPKLWNLERKFGHAGGAEVVVLTEEGQERSFMVGAQIRRGEYGNALKTLSAQGGRWQQAIKRGARFETGPAIRAFKPEIWHYLQHQGYLTVDYTDDGEWLELTRDGVRAVEQGYAEQERLRKRCEAAAAEQGLKFLPTDLHQEEELRFAAGQVVLWQYTDPEGNRFWLDRKITTTIRSPYGGTFAPKPKRVLPSQIGKLLQEEKQDEVSHPKVEDVNAPTDLEAFAKKVMAVALSPQSKKFHDRAFIGSVKDLGFPGMPRHEFDAMLVKAHRARLLRLSRADLVGAMDPVLVRDSEINLDGYTSFHFIALDGTQ